MNYYIYNGTAVVQAEEATYQEWEFSEKDNYSFEEFSIVAKSTSYNIKVGYEGIIAFDEDATPFVLNYTCKTKSNGKIASRTNLEFYDTYENVGQRRLQLIREITKSHEAALN